DDIVLGALQHPAVGQGEPPRDVADPVGHLDLVPGRLRHAADAQLALRVHVGLDRDALRPIRGVAPAAETRHQMPISRPTRSANSEPKACAPAGRVETNSDMSLAGYAAVCSAM